MGLYKTSRSANVDNQPFIINSLVRKYQNNDGINISIPDYVTKLEIETITNTGIAGALNIIYTKSWTVLRRIDGFKGTINNISVNLPSATNRIIRIEGEWSSYNPSAGIMTLTNIKFS